MYLDLHAHTGLLGAFVYGNSYTDVYRFQRHTLFPKHLSYCAPDFSLEHTAYNKDKNKQGTSRRDPNHEKGKGCRDRRDWKRCLPHPFTFFFYYYLFHSFLPLILLYLWPSPPLSNLPSQMTASWNTCCPLSPPVACSQSGVTTFWSVVKNVLQGQTTPGGYVRDLYTGWHRFESNICCSYSFQKKEHWMDMLTADMLFE
ncbi:uncharacterized protein CDAR_166381 [Caerostris darwini]|uniref:Peptidase M14 carboxypeptidase A domain-containing protein n=1 Tax=Caerostris darwini TaxID=1538125 RepID=A0AAV4VVK0_9ARAC|nr:uncharacterized protein CDAR_166381 [Caerostris darwini]